MKLSVNLRSIYIKMGAIKKLGFKGAGAGEPYVLK